MKCEGCGRDGCTPKIYRICLECDGRGCALCQNSIVPGILDGESPEDSPVSDIWVCAQWGDPEVDAGLDDQRPSLIKALARAKNAVLQESGL